MNNKSSGETKYTQVTTRHLQRSGTEAYLDHEYEADIHGCRNNLHPSDTTAQAVLPSWALCQQHDPAIATHERRPLSLYSALLQGLLPEGATVIDATYTLQYVYVLYSLQWHAHLARGSDPASAVRVVQSLVLLGPMTVNAGVAAYTDLTVLYSI